MSVLSLFSYLSASMGHWQMSKRFRRPALDTV
jgi:hypothetical protein